MKHVSRPRVFEHTSALMEAQNSMTRLRKCSKTLHFISGGKGYDNMGQRELDNLRDKVDEADFWLGAAARTLNAGGKRAHRQGYVFDPDKTPGTKADGE